MDGLKPFYDGWVENLESNNYVESLLTGIPANDMKELLVHIADQYFKNIFSILNLFKTFNLEFTKISEHENQWYLYFILNDIHYIINITNRSITTYIYVNTLIIGIIEDGNIK